VRRVLVARSIFERPATIESATRRLFVREGRYEDPNRAPGKPKSFDRAGRSDAAIRETLEFMGFHGKPRGCREVTEAVANAPQRAFKCRISKMKKCLLDKG
jgi:hypothetical protein